MNQFLRYPYNKIEIYPIQDTVPNLAGGGDYADQQLSPEEFLAHQKAVYLEALGVWCGSTQERYGNAVAAYNEIVGDLRRSNGHANDLSGYAQELGHGIAGYSEEVKSGVGEIIRQGGQVFGAVAEYFDPHTWKKVQVAAARGFDADSYTMQEILRSASSKEAREAMKLSLDSSTWKKVQVAAARGFDADSYTMQEILRSASSKEASGIMRWSIGRPYNSVPKKIGQLGIQLPVGAPRGAYAPQDQVAPNHAQLPTTQNPGQLIDTGTPNRGQVGAQDAIVPDGWDFNAPDTSPNKQTAPSRPVKRWQEVLKSGGRIVLRPSDEQKQK